MGSLIYKGQTYGGSGGASAENTLSTTSTNPLQNKIITNLLSNLIDLGYVGIETEGESSTSDYSAGDYLFVNNQGNYKFCAVRTDITEGDTINYSNIYSVSLMQKFEEALDTSKTITYEGAQNTNFPENSISEYMLFPGKISIGANHSGGPAEVQQYPGTLTILSWTPNTMTQVFSVPAAEKIYARFGPYDAEEMECDWGDWVDLTGGNGYTMTPTPSASLTRSDLRTAIASAVTEGGANDDVVSAWAVGNWSNTMTQRVIYSGTITVGDTGIGEWINNSDIATLRAESDLTAREALETTGTGGYGWWKDSHFIIPSGYDYDIKFKFEPHENGEVVTLGGYILDDETGCLCIKFGSPIVNAGTKIAVDVTITQNNISSSGGV